MKELSPEIKELISTHKGRKKRALSMTRPIRCGGRDYIGGVAYTRYGGKMLTEDEVKVLVARNNGSVGGLGVPYETLIKPVAEDDTHA